MLRRFRAARQPAAMLATTLVGLLMIAGLAACGGNNGNGGNGESASPSSTASAATQAPTTANNSPTTPQVGAAGVQEVNIIAKDNQFEPKTYVVAANGSVRITARNEGQGVHEVEVKGLMPETKLSPGQSKSLDLQSIQPGTYIIYCEIHEDQGMEGELVVK
jgi:plastocyanin